MGKIGRPALVQSFPRTALMDDAGAHRSELFPAAAGAFGSPRHSAAAAPGISLPRGCQTRDRGSAKGQRLPALAPALSSSPLAPARCRSSAGANGTANTSTPRTAATGCDSDHPRTEVRPGRETLGAMLQGRGCAGPSVVHASSSGIDPMLLSGGLLY